MESDKASAELVYRVLNRALLLGPTGRFAVWYEQIEDEDGNVTSEESHNMTFQEYMFRVVGEELLNELGPTTNELLETLILNTYRGAEREVPTGNPYKVQFVGMYGRGRKTRRTRRSK